MDHKIISLKDIFDCINSSFVDKQCIYCQSKLVKSDHFDKKFICSICCFSIQKYGILSFACRRILDEYQMEMYFSDTNRKKVYNFRLFKGSKIVHFIAGKTDPNLIHGFLFPKSNLKTKIENFLLLK
jgi:hypothetical protein